MLVKPSSREAAWSFTGGSGVPSVAGAPPHPVIAVARTTTVAMANRVHAVTPRILLAVIGAVEEARPFLVNGLRPARDDFGRREGPLVDLDQGAVAPAHAEHSVPPEFQLADGVPETLRDPSPGR